LFFRYGGRVQFALRVSELRYRPRADLSKRTNAARLENHLGLLLTQYLCISLRELLSHWNYLNRAALEHELL
jgi:hypothetical protein